MNRSQRINKLLKAQEYAQELLDSIPKRIADSMSIKSSFSDMLSVGDIIHGNYDLIIYNKETKDPDKKQALRVISNLIATATSNKFGGKVFEDRLCFVYTNPVVVIQF